MAEDWRGDLEEWLAPFLMALRHKTRMRLCPAYIARLDGRFPRVVDKLARVQLLILDDWGVELH